MSERIGLFKDAIKRIEGAEIWSLLWYGMDYDPARDEALSLDEYLHRRIQAEVEQSKETAMLMYTEIADLLEQTSNLSQISMSQAEIFIKIQHKYEHVLQVSEKLGNYMYRALFEERCGDMQYYAAWQDAMSLATVAHWYRQEKSKGVSAENFLQSLIDGKHKNWEDTT